MPATLLDSQLATLEPLDRDEPGAVIDIDQPISQIQEMACSQLQRFRLRTH
jgi:gluconokinase